VRRVLGSWPGRPRPGCPLLESEKLERREEEVPDVDLETEEEIEEAEAAKEVEEAKEAERKTGENRQEEQEDKRALEEWLNEVYVPEEETEQEEVERRLGGRLSNSPYPQRWDTIGNRKMVEGGVRSDWIDGPPTEAADHTRRERYSGVMHDAMVRAIEEEKARGVLEVVSAAVVWFVMAAFVLIKAGGKVRLILDCRPINEYIRQQSFKMTDWADLKRRLVVGMYGVTLDFSAAFHHLGVNEELRQLLNFRYDGVTYRYVGLPFGLRSAPRLFCAAMAATMNAVRARWNVVAFSYMDDVVLLHEDGDYLKTAVEEIVKFIT
jgi:hypothetical protein